MRGLVVWVCAVVVSLFGFLPASGAASPDLKNDPQWIALMGSAPRAAGSGLAARGSSPAARNKSCTASASCGTYSINCSGSGAESCQGVDKNCGAGQTGYVRCGSRYTYCAQCVVDPEPNPCPYGYYWNPQDYCCYPIEFGYPPLCY